MFLYSLKCLIDEMDERRQYEVNLMLQEISACQRDYNINLCQPESRVPVLEKFCLEKEICLAKNPNALITRGKILATIFSDIIETFMDGIALRSFSVIAIFMLL